MESPKSATILYIEDNEANRQLVQFILARKKHLTLLCAADGQSGLQTARVELPDIILLDISLPDINGYEVLATLKQDSATENIPVIAVSGDHIQQNSDGQPFVFDSYLTKPIEVGPLYQVIDHYLQPSHSQPT